jgi:hypothetical protein
VSNTSSSTTTTESAQQLSELLEELRQNINGKSVSIDDVVEVLGVRSHGPVLLIFGLLSTLPTGAIPGGSLIMIVSIEMLLGRGRIWLPRFISQRCVSRKRFKRSVDQAIPWARWLEGFTSTRWQWATTFPMTLVIAVVCLALGLSMWPLALFPFGVLPVGLAITGIGWGLVTRDGFVVLISLGLSAIAFGVLAWLVWTWGI